MAPLTRARLLRDHQSRRPRKSRRGCARRRTGRSTPPSRRQVGFFLHGAGKAPHMSGRAAAAARRFDREHVAGDRRTETAGHRPVSRQTANNWGASSADNCYASPKCACGWRVTTYPTRRHLNDDAGSTRGRLLALISPWNVPFMTSTWKSPRRRSPSGNNQAVPSN